MTYNAWFEQWPNVVDLAEWLWKTDNFYKENVNCIFDMLREPWRFGDEWDDFQADSEYHKDPSFELEHLPEPEF